MKKRFIGIALLSCAVVAVSPALADNSWGNYHWARTNNPFTLRVVDAVSPTWDPYLDEAIADWSASSVLNLTEEAGTDINTKKCTAMAGKILACNALYGQRGWLGLASIWASGNHITQATTKVNDTYFNMAQYNTPAWRRMVMCQEIAHDFGLDHQDEGFGPPNLGSCMDYTDDPDGGGAFGPSNEHPNAHDFAQLETIYAHLDASNSYSASVSTNFGIRTVGGPPASPPGLSEEAGDSPAEWGRAIGTDGRGRPNLYVQDLGGGRKKFTHVFWAIGEGPRN
ncbi:MAG: hypothetical protein ACR2FK_06910 [Sphingomicrobium sp.]